MIILIKKIHLEKGLFNKNKNHTFTKLIKNKKIL